MKTWFVLAPLVLFVTPSVQVVPDDWGLIVNEPAAFPGYTLFAPLNHNSTYLIDMQGEIVHKWDHEDQVGNSVYLLPDGRLLRPMHVRDNEIFGAPPFGGGRLQIIAWDGTVEWDYSLSSDHRYQHHDIVPMPNGNVLALAWEHKTRDEATAAGRDPDLLNGDKLFPESIVEIRPSGPTTGEVIWEWSLWDHLIQDVDVSKANYGVVSDHPELLDINFINGRGSDWNHSNGIDYNPELDQIIVSMRSMNEFYVLDHSTTTEEAARHQGGRHGKGGDFLYRWGNPQGYLRGRERDRTLYGQHNAHWIDPGLPGGGDILVFNNGANRPNGDWSSVDQVRPPMNESGRYRLEDGKPYGPADLAWTYAADPREAFYSSFISGSQRLPNGNTLICAGSTSRFFEVTPEGEVVWEYRSAFARPDAPEGAGGLLPPGAPQPDLGDRSMGGVGVFRAIRYAPDYSGFDGKGLPPAIGISGR